MFYGDPRFSDVPIDVLLSDAYNDARRCQIDPMRASFEFRPGRLGDSEARAARILANAGRQQPGGFGQGEPTFAPLPELRGDTTHLDAVDRWGNMLSATPSRRLDPVVARRGGLGFNITTRGQMFYLDERHANSLGPAQAAADDADAFAGAARRAGRGWRSARRAATSRTSGRCSSS